MLLIVFNRFSWKSNSVLQWDAAGYYSYLPAVFIYRDLGHYAFYPEVNAEYGLTPGADFYALYLQPNGRRANKYPPGVAVFEAPFFVAAHLLTTQLTGYRPDGFSPLYRLFVCLGTVFWAIAGLWVLRAMLRRYFPDGVVCASLLLVLFATNLYNYAAFDFGMSHPFSFFLFAAALSQADRWHRTPRPGTLILLGFIAGLIVIVRPTNVLLLPLLACWQLRQFRNPLPELWRQRAAGMVTALVFLAVVAIQLAYWKYASGSWIHYAYEGEGFDFKHPQLLNGLFSVRKGWFVYTPLALFACLGIVLLLRRMLPLGVAIVSYVAAAAVVSFSWHQWWYGGSFGCRAMIESLAVLSLPLAFLVSWLLRRPRFLRGAGLTLLALCLALNVWQTYQFSLAVIPTDGNTAEWYRHAFFKIEKTPEDEVLFNKLFR